MGKSAQVLNAPKRAWQVIIPATSVDRAQQPPDGRQWAKSRRPRALT